MVLDETGIVKGVEGVEAGFNGTLESSFAIDIATES